jgi:hypothetical protein
MLELVRALGLARKERAGKAGFLRSRSKTDSAAPAHDLTVLRRRLKSLVAPIDLGDEAALRAVRRPLLQEIILWEFGGDFRQHPELASMLEKVEQTLDVDPQARERLVRMIRQLQQ